MPDPISSSTASTQASLPDYDPSLDEAGALCRADAANSSPAEPPRSSRSPAVPQLVSSVPRPPSALPPASSASMANNNAQRTAERNGVAPYASAGKTAAGDAAYVALAALKGRDPKSGGEVEILSASLQVGRQNEAQVTYVRVGGSSGALIGSAEAFTAHANLGVHNDDGSTGVNLGYGVNAISFEATVGHETSVTAGLSASVGQGASLGLRDLDHDAKTELCARVSTGPITVGLCVENPL
ncbi:MAG TPA: hypothetical protein VEQ59_05305 [Polyangiaceae bacterium]|nr:hypothetical protein [Polyangiaceae bacterium]